MKKRVYRGVYPQGMNRVKIVELFKSGRRPYEIASLLRISHQAVYAILKSERAKGNLKK
jgi:DNA-binding CsgD family transcriptional regulator